MPTTPDELFAALDRLGIAHPTVRHPPLFTVEQSQGLRGTIAGGHTKNLFLRDKKGALFLVTALEDAVLNTPGIDGVVLRYGRLYGPGTWFDKPGSAGALTTDAAAHAALLAMTRGAPGIYNIAEDDGEFSVEKARRELGFDPAFRMAA